MAIDKIQSESINLADNFAFTGTVSGAGGTNTPNFRAKITTDTDFTTGQYNAVTFPSEDYDTASAYNTSDGKFTVPSGQGGKYFIYSQLITNAKASSELEFMTMNLYKNGSNYRSVQCYFVSNPIRRFGLNLVTIENLSAGDYLQMYVYVDDASGNPDLYNDSTNPNFFGAYKIIE
jgi:hypothetical protein